MRSLPGSLSRIPKALALATVTLMSALWLALVAVPLLEVGKQVGSAAALFDPQVLAVVRITLIQAAASTVIASLLGVPLGLWACAASGKTARLCSWLLEIPFGVPTVVAAMCWVIWLGRTGPITSAFGDPGWLYSLKAVVLAHVAYNVPWIALLVSRAGREVPSPLLEAAATLGAGPVARFRWIVWPEIRWAFLSAAVQAFSYCAMSFALVLLLGGGPPVETLETALYGRVRLGALDLPGAAACALWELLVTLVPWSLVLWFRSRNERPAAMLRERLGPLGGRVGRIASAALVILAALFVAPYLAIFSQTSFLSGEAAQAAWSALAVSLRLGGGAALLAVIAGCVAILATGGLRGPARHVASVLLMIPGGISALVLALGLWMAYRDWVDPFEGSLGAMMALQATLFFPVVYRMLWPVAQRMPLGLIDAARGLGASPVRAFWLVDGRRWIWPVVSAFTLVFAASLGEVAAVSFFYSEELIPLPLLVSRWMGQYRFEEARFVAALLFSLSAGAVTLVFALRSMAAREGVLNEFPNGFGSGARPR